MKKAAYTTLLLLLTITVFSGCTGAKEAAKAPHPLTGAWDYTLDTP